MSTEVNFFNIIIPPKVWCMGDSYFLLCSPFSSKQFGQFAVIFCYIPSFI